MPRRGNAVNGWPPPRSPPVWRPGPPGCPAAPSATTRQPATRPCRTRSGALLAPPSGALESWRPLLDARHLRLDHVLAGPGTVEEFLVRRPRIVVGAVVVEHPLGVLQR